MPTKNSFIKGQTVPIKPLPIKKKTVPKRFAPEPPPRKSGKPYFVIILIIAMGLSAAYLLIKGINVADYSSKNAETSNSPDEQAADSVTGNVVDRVKKHILVNENEAPYVATISNIDLVRARNPVFYQDASQGDKVLIWSDKAIIYSESLDKIVSVTTSIPSNMEKTLEDVGEGDVGEQQDGEGQESEEAVVEELEEVTIEIRNGTRVAGAASRLKAELTKLGVDVERIGDAANAYEGTRIIDLTGGKANTVVQTIVDATEGTLSSDMPEGEPASGSNILVIIGL